MKANGYTFVAMDIKCDTTTTPDINPYCYKPTSYLGSLFFQIEMDIRR